MSENNANAATNSQGATSTSNAQTTTTTDGNTQTTTTDSNTPATNSPAATSAASNNNGQNTNGGSTATDNGGQSNGSQEGGALGIPVIVGIVVGSVAVVLMIAAFVIWYRRTKRPRSPRYDTTDHYTGTTSSRKEYGDRVYSHTIPVAIPISGGDYFDEITSTEILGRRSEMDDMMTGSWDDPEIQEARIPMENLRVQQLINRGGFGEVFLGTYRGRAVAVKRLLPDRRKNMREVEAFIVEIKIMLSMDHPRIVGCLGVAWESWTDISAVTEYMEGGDLRTVLERFEQQEHRAHGFDDDKLNIALHVAQGLTYLHGMDPIVLHRDLKSKNILLNKNLDAKLTDFGVSRESADITMTAGVGTSLWMAPESLFSIPPKTMKEFSLESLKNDTEDVVGRVKDTLFGSGSGDGSGNSNRKEKPEPTTRTPSMPTKSTTDDSGSTETDSKTTKAPRSTTQKTTDEKPEKSGTKTHSGSTGDSYSWDYFEGSGVTTPAPDSTTASPFTILPATPTVPPTPTPAATANSSAYESTQQISTSNSSTSLPGGAIAGVVVGAACVMFMIAAFVTMKKRAASQRFSLSKLPSVFGESRAVPLAISRLAPPGAFGKLNSGRSEMDDPNMSGIFTISRDDPFTRRHMRKGGIWDDPSF
ncbi:hypothetical protein PRIC2_009792 [Phytophthora ramorum]